MKRVLIVTYHYPPADAVGGVRPSKLVRYLPEFGWEPTVLTVPAPEAASREEGQDAPVVRVREWPHPLKLYRSVKSRYAGRVDDGGERRTFGGDAGPSRQGAGLKRAAIAWLGVPDQAISWLAPAVRRGARLMRATGIRHVITTGPPFTCHLIGLVLQRRTGAAWVADFRDPWSLDQKPADYRTAGTDALETRLARAVMARADLVVSVTDVMTDEARKTFAFLDRNKFVTIPSGFDPEDFHGLAGLRPAAPPVLISYVGTFYHGRTPEPFLRALRVLLDDGRLRASEVRVRLTGRVDYAEGKSVVGLVEELRLDGIVTLSPPVSRREALRQAVSSHVALVLDERHPAQVPYKLYEALGAGQIVLNVGSGGAVRDVLSKTGRGVAVHYLRSEEIARGILECVQRVRLQQAEGAGAEPWRQAAIQPFHFRKVTAEMAGCLDRVRSAGTAERGRT